MGASKYNAIYMVILAILPQGGIDVLVVQQPQHWNAH